VLLIDIIIANIGLLSLVRRRENGVPPFIMIICVALFLLVHRCLVIWLWSRSRSSSRSQSRDIRV